VDVNCQKPASVEIEADDNILPLVQTDVRGGVLYVSTTKSYSSSGGIKLRITVPDLASVKSTGAGKFNISGVKNDKFEIRSTGAATVVASGQSKSVKISSTGAGKIDAHELRASDADVSVTGAAAVDVYATDELDVNVLVPAQEIETLRLRLVLVYTRDKDATRHGQTSSSGVTTSSVTTCLQAGQRRRRDWLRRTSLHAGHRDDALPGRGRPRRGRAV